MPPISEPPPENQIPLAVDLDGTLIKTDLLWEFIARLLRKNPFSIFQILFWWTRSRAFLKRKLSARVKLDPATLPFNEEFLAWLREQKSAGRKIILATASDLQMAKPVADFVGIFDEVLGSDGKTNLRKENKLKALVEKFGDRGFDYAGNSPDDLAVWRGAREAIVVNASRTVSKQAAYYSKVGATFDDNYSPLTIPKSFLDELFIRSGYLAAIAAGFLLALAFPNFNANLSVAGFAWVAPALLIFAARGKNSGDKFRVGYISGISFWLASLYWLLLIPVAGFPILGWIFLSAFLALFTAVWVWLVAGKVGEGNWAQRNLWSLLGAAVWVALEMFRARIFGGFPWSFIGVSQFKLIPLIQLASVTGVYGVSFLVVWFSLCLFSAGLMIFKKSKSRFAWQPEVFFPLFAVVVIFAWGEFRIAAQNPAASNLRVTMIQPSVPQNLIWDGSQNTNRFRDLLALSENAMTNKTDLLVWPEAALPQFDDANYSAITNLIRAHHVWMIFNADDVLPKTNPAAKDDYDVFNSAFLFSPDGNCAAVYHKQKLVMFGEYIPLVRWLPFVKWLTPIQDGYEAGNFSTQFEMPDLGINAAPLICFEDTFPQTARKSAQADTDFLINLTNDGWFGQSAEQWQHMANAVFRAVENGVPLVRCCNNGVTCWIDLHGRVRQIFRDKNGGIYGGGAMTVELPLQKHAPTFYNRHGDRFGWSCAGLTIVIAFIRLRQNIFR